MTLLFPKLKGVSQINNVLRVLYLSILVVIVAACGQPHNIYENTDSVEAEVGDVRDVTILGSVLGGGFYSQSSAIADLVNNRTNDLRVTVEATSGGHQNAYILENQHNAIGITSAVAVSEFQEGDGFFPFQAENLTIIAEARPIQVHLVVRESSSINSFSDLEGRIVNPGARGSGTESIVPSILAPLGMSYEDFASVEYLAFGDAADAMSNGSVDAIFWIGDYPASSIQEMAVSTGIRLVSLTEEEQELLLESSPFFDPISIPGDAYGGDGDPTSTIEVPSLLIVNRNMPEDIVYSITKLLDENQERLGEANQAINQWNISGDVSDIADLHPGAARYYDE
ncbi:TAXI family TRAP transporter solute-binding subunit [Geomicrobium sp. JSM 1781026]|uniref:TAXI family TRAP transporter solute-binding subunit n=1 Tax=Geomicrobium sp. JSM 1781026 TaxID=3344580 RepID=UPI0035BEE04C